MTHEMINHRGPEFARVIAEVTEGLKRCLRTSGDVRTDEWGIDVAMTASQKAWAAPPGLSMVTMSERAWAAYKVAKMPRYYWDLGQAKSWLEKGQTLATPAVSIFFALQEALRLLEQ